MSGGPYSRLYHAVRDEFPTVYESDVQLATFVRMLMQADKYYPQMAPMPPRRPPVQALIRHSLVIPSDDMRSFTIRGLQAERERRSAPGRHAASVRWHTNADAPADANAMPDETRRDENKTSSGANASNGAPTTFMHFRPKKQPTTDESPTSGLWFGKGTHDGRHG